MDGLPVPRIIPDTMPSTPTHRNADFVTSPLPASSPVPASFSASVPPTPTPASRNRQARTYIDGVRKVPKKGQEWWGSMTVGKGSQTTEILRTGALLGQVDRSEVNRTFTRNLSRILLLCERLADETDCWLYIAANHPSVKGEHTHWTSPVMSNDVPSQHLEPFRDHSARLFRALKKARRHDVADVELQAAQARSERDEARSSAAEKQVIIDALNAHLQSQGVDMATILAQALAQGGGSST
ncbi:hypothetical protein V5O48_018678 [Marasmius crinis-equi]|uniref:Uncharacterized protein n=1 Tax=Marasmius crinis-equi TaxID=585013 RepID=A0ABR3EKI9_9AGAR